MLPVKSAERHVRQDEQDDDLDLPGEEIGDDGGHRTNPPSTLPLAPGRGIPRTGR